ncbi:hypothetical protein L7F22_011749 [Adiantum nelumboides]|nr:hypothetical protein [Adiantum nelumboides]
MTRWAEATTTSRITAVEVAKFIFAHICCRFGVPLEIFSDRGPVFRGDLVGELMKKLKIKRRHSTPYYPQCNGLVEKVNDYAGSYSRLRAHLLGIEKQGIGLCLKATSDNKASMAHEEHESSNKKEKESNVYPSQLKRKAHDQHSLESMFNASCREEVDETVARYFYACDLPFTLAQSPYFSEMVSAIASFGKGYKAPNYQKSCTTLLGNEKGRIERSLSFVEASWQHFGCSLISDDWIDTAKRPLINFVVSSRHEGQFSRALSLVIVDNVANCKFADQLIELEFKHIFWTPCTTHCLNLLLKNLMAIEWIADAITKGKEVQQFITNHDAIRAMFGKHSKLKLIRPGENRFASHFMMLHRLVRVKTALKHLVICEEWDIWKSQNMDAKDIEKTILDFEFWDEIQRYVKVCWPVMTMLRMVNRDDACMGVMFEGMDQMVEKIKEIILEEADGEAMFEEMNVYIQARWLMMNSPLHATAFLLNPKWFPKAPLKDAEVMKG